MKKLQKILLIDDDEVTNFINKSLLESLNIAHEIVIQINGKRALNYLLEQCSDESYPELIILEHHIPVMDGLEFIKALHNVNFFHSHRIIFLLLAAHTTQKYIEIFKNLGVQEFTYKPLSKETVMDVHYKYWRGDESQKES